MFYCTGDAQFSNKIPPRLIKIPTLGMIIEYSVSCTRSYQDLLCDRCVNIYLSFYFMIIYFIIAYKSLVTKCPNYLLFQSYCYCKWDTDKHKSNDFLLNPVCIILNSCFYRI